MSTDNARHGIPILGPMLEERLFDPHDAPENNRWTPFNREARELASCVEACKHVLELRPLLTERPSARTYALLTTPVFSLVEHVVALQRVLGQRDRRDWPARDRENFTRLGRSLRKLVRGQLKKLRDKRSAHHDHDALRPGSDVPAAKADVVLPPLGHALLLLMLALNHDATFGYYRFPDASKPREMQVTIEYPIATTLLLDEHSVPFVVAACHLVTDPRREIDVVVQAAVALYNHMAESDAAAAHDYSSCLASDERQIRLRKRRDSNSLVRALLTRSRPPLLRRPCGDRLR